MMVEQKLDAYKVALKKYRAEWRDYRLAYALWFRRGGTEGGGGAWDWSEREYSKAPEPVKPTDAQPTPQQFGITSKIEMDLAAEIEKKVMG